MKGRILTGAVLMTITLLLLAACGDEPDAASEATADRSMANAEAMQPIAVEAVTVGREALVGDIVASGLIRGAREVTVISETQGTVEAVGFELGDAVDEGQVLVSMDDAIQALTVAEAREALASAELDLTTTERLVSSGNASQVQLARARSAVAGARARLAQAEKAQADRTIEAPISGLVASKESSVQAGNFLNAGVPVARIVDTSELEIELSLGEREVQYVADDAPAFVSFPAAGESELRATVRAVAAGSDPATGSFPVVVRFVNTVGSRARSGLSATVRIPPVGSPRAVVVPANAVQSEGAERYVFVATPDSFALRRTVQIGERFGDRVVVTDGLDVGERVIVSGIGSLADRQRVAVTPRVAGE